MRSAKPSSHMKASPIYTTAPPKGRLPSSKLKGFWNERRARHATELYVPPERKPYR